MVLIKSQDGYIEEFNKQKIIDALTKDIAFLGAASDKPTSEEVVKVASKVKSLVGKMDLNEDDILSSDTIRGLVTTELRKSGFHELADVAEIVGPRVTDVLNVWGVSGDRTHDNANLDAENQETMHKRLADIVSEKMMIKMLPSELSKPHSEGYYHIHDREYFFTRQFCFDSDLRYILYYGLYPDGKGSSLPVARAARSAEVAFLHAAKALGSSQCNCAGGQGYQSFNVLISPYLKGKSYEEIKQLAQMFIYEMSQMMVSRGGQAIFSSIQLYPGVPSVWKNIPIVMCGKVFNGKDGNTLITYGEYENETRLLFKAILEVVYEGDCRGRPFSFPKIEIVISNEFIEGI